MKRVTPPSDETKNTNERDKKSPKVMNSPYQPRLVASAIEAELLGPEQVEGPAIHNPDHHAEGRWHSHLETPSSIRFTL